MGGMWENHTEQGSKSPEAKMGGCHLPPPWGREVLPECRDKEGCLRDAAIPQSSLCKKGTKGTNALMYSLPSVQFPATIHHWLKPVGAGQERVRKAFIQIILVRSSWGTEQDGDGGVDLKGQIEDT